MTDTLPRDQLRSIIERVERMNEEAKTIADDIRDIYAEAKSNGYCPKALRKIVAMRKKDENTRREEDAILDSYLVALGMAPEFDFGQEDAA